MRKALSLVLLAIFVSSAILPASAQKSRIDRSGTNRSPKAQTSFAAVRAVSGGAGVFVEWTMDAEADIHGFFIYKKGKGGPQLVNGTKFVTGTALQVGRGTYFGERYSYYDPSGLPGESYYVESVGNDGKRTVSRAVAAEYAAHSKTAPAESFSAEAANAVPEPHTWIEQRRLSPSRELGAAIKAGAHRMDAANHAAVIAQPGVRIGVKKEGMYRVSRQQLEGGGFNGGADPDLWQLYLDGVEQAIVVGPNGDYIEFYGKGVDTVETDTQMYYLIVGNSPGKRISARSADAGSDSPVSSGYMQSFTVKERVNAASSIINGSAENYFGRSIVLGMFSPIIVNLPVNITGIDPAGPNAVIELKLQGFSISNHNVEVTLNGSALPAITFQNIRPFSATYSVPPALLVDGVNNFQFKASGGPNVDSTFFDSMTIWYQRSYAADNNALLYFTKNLETVQLEGFSSSNIRVFDTTAADEPVLITGLSPYADGAEWSVDVPAGSPKVMFAVEDSGLLNSVTVSPIVPTILRTTSNEAQLIIISHPDFLAEAETWANYRRGQGFKAVVADVNDIYDEFDYGKLGTSAIENFLQYAAENWQTPPGYVLLLGDATYDPHNYEGKPGNFVPSRQVNTLYSEVPSDEAMADFNDDGLSELAIGRIPAQTPADVTIAFNKTVSFESSLANKLNRGALFAYDNPDPAGLDFEEISAQFSAELPEAMSKSNVAKWDPNSTTELINQMNTGKYVVNYEGHGIASSWAGGFFSMGNVPSLTNAGQESIYLMLTCFNGAFARVGMQTSGGFDYFDSLGEELIKHPNGGAVSAWSSPGKTTLDVHDVMGRRFFQQLGAGDIDRLGDLVMDAKATLNAGPEVRLAWVMLGDPMLKTH